MKARVAILLLGLVALMGPAATPALADTTVQQIQLGQIVDHGVVQCERVVVTGVGRFGFFIEEPDSATAPPEVTERKYSGIWVYTNSTPTVQKGDQVDVRGTYYEYFSNSEIDVTLSISPPAFVHKTGTATIPHPVYRRINEVNDTGAYAEAYEGVLVKVDRNDTSLFTYPVGQYDTFYLRTNSDGTGDSLMVRRFTSGGDLDFVFDLPSPGTQLTYVKGILDYYRSHYRLCPRDCENDFGFAAGGGCKPRLRGAYATSTTTINVQFGVDVEQASAENPANYQLAGGYEILSAQRDPVNHKLVHLTNEEEDNGQPEQIIVSGVRSESGGIMMDPNQTYDFRSGITPIRNIQFVSNPASGDASPLLAAVVTIQGRVTAVDGNYYYIQDGDGGAWRGIYCFVAAVGNMAVGDSVQVSGQVQEYQYLTEVGYKSGIDNFRNFGRAPKAPVVNVVTANQIPFRNASRTAEPWEDCLIRLNNATVKDSIPGIGGPYFSEYPLRQETNPIYPDTTRIDLNGLYTVSYDPCVGDRIDAIGILRHILYNSPTGSYVIAPRSGRGYDIIVVYDNPACAPTSVEGPTRNDAALLAQNQPNPFGPGTEIRFSLPAPGAVSLEVLDVGGRLVRRLASGFKEAGVHSVQWDGRSSEGRPVAAGTYFYRLKADGKEVSRRMVLLR